VGKKVLVVGIDGMDPLVLEELIEKGQMPNFARMREAGDYRTLATVTPPQSPVAWSVMITGQDPGGTGVFDFIHRNPMSMVPFLSTSRVEEPERTMKLGDCVLPLEPGSVELLRDGKAFWEILDEHDVRATVLKMPANFPPVEGRARTLSGMGTPDMAGSYGTYHFYTDDVSLLGAASGGGEVRRVTMVDGKAEAELPGPPSLLVNGGPATVPFTIYADPEEEIVRIDIFGERLLLARGEWSHWVRGSFALCPGTFLEYLPNLRVSGTVRFHLAGAHPYLRLYASPVNMDPFAPALPISTPPELAAEIAESIGPYYTQGMAEDTQALAAGLLDDQAYMDQAAIILEEENRMLGYALDRFEDGFLFVYFSVVDQVSHMMWRAMDPRHAAWTPELGRRFGDAIPSMYRAMDEMLGHTLERLDDDTTVLVISDHGFAPYYREVNLNTWLKDQGYLVLTDDSLESRTSYFNHVDWGRTRAYSLGFNSLYLNRLGRERRGIVEPGEEADALMDEIEARLKAVMDHATGESIVTQVYRASQTYQGRHVDDAPDMVVGFRRGYGASDDSALGTLTRPIIQDRAEAWSGNHLMETSAVPGILLVNRTIQVDDPELKDIAPTILDLFDIEPTPEMTGRPLLATH
jgi:predicted AlkP superfamily phosphohydrolase/phosphomutase